ncbi:kinase-like domain-containing protein [Russula vinacea]|nr:kinase-like domain-containing protein [Russula vinacea]
MSAALLSPIYSSPATPALDLSPQLPPMDSSDCSDDDGDHLHTPLHLPDTNTAIASHSDRPFPSSNHSTDFFDLAQPKYLHSSHVSRSISPFYASEQHSSFEFSDQLSSSHSHSHNALQLDPLTTDLSPQTSDLSLASSSSQSASPLAYDSHDEFPSVPFPLRHPRLLPSTYSRRFPRGHHLNAEFVRWYQLGDELGAGGYGFVLTAFHRLELREVAIKFIIKAKVPAHAWMEDKSARRVPTEALLLGLLSHPNIVKCMDLFEDDLYFYLVQELHGTPPLARVPIAVPGKASPCPPTPALTPSPSVDSDLHLPITPPRSSAGTSDFSGSAKQLSSSPNVILGSAGLSPSCPRPSQPAFFRRPSHDLFECIEHAFCIAQIVEAVHYLDSQGVTHCDIKDENILVDNYLNVKLVDFGSAVVVDPSEPRPTYTLFFGTTAYAASEVLQKKPYRAPPAEMWTLGVLLSYLLTGASPFPTERDAIAGRVSLAVHASDHVPESAEQLMLRCLDPDPERRANIHEVRAHPWLVGASDLPMEERIL